MSPLRRRGTAQAGFPEDRGVWVGVAVVLTLLLAWWAIDHGPYGGPITTAGAVMRTLVLLLLAAIPVAALVWAWRRLSRRAQAIAPIPIGVLVAFLGLYAIAHAGIYMERVRMGTEPARLAESAFAEGDRQLWAVSDSTNAVHVPPVLNRCLINKYGFRTIPGTDGMTVSPKHASYRQSAAERAEAYNAVVLQRLRVPTAEVNRFADGSDCPE
jgi:hypothetical protein